MSVISRTVISNPERTSVETWTKITEIICALNSEVKVEFDKVSNIAASLLSEELTKDYPIIMKGAGSQLRIYCIYGDDAISGEDASEDLLSWDITAKAWKIYLPCSTEQLQWYDNALTELNDKFKVYDTKNGIDKEEYSNNENNKVEFKIDEEAFRKL